MNYRTLIIGAAVSLTASTLFAVDGTGKGLDSLSEDRVMTELAKRKLDVLLERSFVANKVPEPKQNAIRASSALARLKSDQNIPLTEQRKLVADYVKALPQLLPQVSDPRSLMSDADILIEHGIQTDQRLLEYFGTNASIQIRLRPTAEAVQAMLVKARELALAAAEKAANNWPGGRAAWQRADEMATNAEYTRNILTYSWAVSVDKADKARETALNDAIENLSAFDDPSAPPINLAFVKFYLGKLRYALATPDALKQAKADFAFVAEKGDPNNVGQQFDARFLAALVDMAAKDVNAAKASVAALGEWTKQKNMADKPDVKVAAAAMDYRLLSMQSELANGAEKQTLADNADKVLIKLQQEQPALRGLILELMAARVKPDAPVAGLNELLLQSLLVKAEAETMKDDKDPFDKAVVARGIEAAKELLKKERKVDAVVTAAAEYDIPFFHRKLDQKVEAATSFFDYVDKHKATGDAATKTRVETAFNNAMTLVGELYKTDMTKPEVSVLYDRALRTAVAKPFERMEFAFQLARRLQVTGKVDEAVELFKKVPATAKEAGDARYFTLVALHAKLSKMKPDDPKRGALLAEVQKLADEVNGLFSKQIATADAKLKQVLQMRVAQTRLLGADLALRDQKDAKRAIELLKDFEATISGVPGENEMMGEVLLLRVQAFYALGQVDQATEVVVKLAQQRPKETGAIVFNLLTKMGEQQDEARAAGNEARVQELQANRAALTPFYVKWIENNPDPQLRKQIYNARVFNAETQRQAAASEKNEAKRKDLLEGAKKQFEQLDTKESFQQFLELQPEAIRPKLKYDPLVKMGLARTQMALGQHAEARKQTSQLFHDKILGTGTKTEVTPGGEVVQKDNPNYWEAQIILVRSNVALNENVEAMKRWLREQWVVYGDNAGGQLWKDDFLKLCKELSVEKPAVDGVAAVPATQPAPAQR